jgi:hypothetical protein
MIQIIFNTLIIIYMILSCANILGQLTQIPEEYEKIKKHMYLAFGLNLFFIIYAIYLFF